MDFNDLFEVDEETERKMRSYKIKAKIQQSLNETNRGKVMVMQIPMIIMMIVIVMM